METKLVHPGSILKDELDQRGYTQKDFANEIQIAHSQFNEIIKGKRSITSDIALLLEAALGIDAIFWLNLQSAYDLNKSRVEQNPITPNLEKLRRIRQAVPYLFFKKMNILTGDVTADEEIVKKIYDVNSLQELSDKVLKYEGAQKFRKSDYNTVNEVNVIGWLSLVDYKTRYQHVSPFNPDVEDDLIFKLRKIFSESKPKNVINKTEEILNEAGIKFVKQEKPDKAPIDGVAFWSKNNPVIGLTQRHNRLDNFVFTLFHELGHIFLHSDQIKDKGLAIDQIDDLDNYSDNLKVKEEFEANQYASNKLIPEVDWDSFKRDYDFSDEAISRFADKVGINSAIVVGRLRFENPILYRRRFRISNEIL